MALVGRTVKRPAGLPVSYLFVGSFAGKIPVKLVCENPSLVGIQKPIRADQAVEEELFAVQADNPGGTKTMDVFRCDDVTVVC
jgi:hypothetical protein